MNRKQLLSILAVVAMVASVFAGAGMAADFVADDGESVTAKSVNPLQLTKGDTGNITVQMTEDQSGSTSYFYNTSAEADSLDVTMSSGTLSGTRITADGFYVNTSATSDTVGSVNVTLDQTTNESDSGIYTGEAMDNGSYLIEDPDASETVDYIVVDTYAEKSYSVSGLDAEFNRSDGDLRFSETGSGQFTVDLNRTNTTYSEYGVDTLQYEVWVNTTYFTNIEDTTQTAADTIVLSDVTTANGYKQYTFTVQNPDNTTAAYWDDIGVSVNATMVSGSANDTFVVRETHDPTSGGPQASYDGAFDHGAGAGASTGDFQDIPPIALGVGVIALGGVLFLLTRGSDNSVMSSKSGWRNNRANAKLEAMSPTTVADSRLMIAGWAFTLLGGIVFMADGFLQLGIFISGGVLDLGLDGTQALIVGAVLVLIAAVWSYREME